jgi:predicted nucleotidyltransferase component of viral defense system
MQEMEVRRKLAETAKNLGLRMPEVQLLLCQERFIARLGHIAEGHAFVWKGGSLILRLYRVEGLPRYTIDIDFTVKGIPFNDVPAALEKAMAIDLKDGFIFRSVTKESIERDLPYGGDRFVFEWSFFSKNASRKLTVDVCTGDAVEPDKVSSEEVFLIPFLSEKIELKVYPKEFVFAEKLETVFRFRTGNSRCKDFVDMWMLIQSGMHPEKLSSAIKKCFENRGSIFSIATLRGILSDKLFQERLEIHRQRHFKELSAPEMKTIMVD